MTPVQQRGVAGAPAGVVQGAGCSRDLGVGWRDASTSEGACWRTVGQETQCSQVLQKAHQAPEDMLN